MEKTIYSKLLDFQKKVEVIKKDAKNPFFKNNYATLGNIISEVKPLLNSLGLVLTQPIIDGNIMSVIFDGETNESIKSEIPLPVGVKPQDLGSAITYYRRYTLTSLLALEIDEDDDGNKASTTPVKKEAEKVWLNPNTETWTKAVEAMKNGTVVSLDQIKAKYALSAKNEELFMKQVNTK